MQYLRSNVRLLSEKVYLLIQKLNEVSGGGYKALYPVYSRIQQELQEFLSRRKKIPADAQVLALEEITREKEDSVGGKMANLGELHNRVHVAVPEGFAITAQAYKDFIDAHELQEAISRRLARLDIDNLEDLIVVSREIRELILEKELPPPLKSAIDREIRSLVSRHGPELSLAVRSSALGEDSKISFAGQYGTVLNVLPDQVERRYREIVASKFTPRAIFYFLGKGFREEDLAMGTGCLVMVRARAAGVLYTVDPLNPDRDELIIHAHWGLGQAVVDGTVTPDVFRVSKKAPFPVRESVIARKERLLSCTSGGDLETVCVPPGDQESSSLSETEIQKLAETALRIEEHYKQPQDIEWAVDGQGRPGRSRYLKPRRTGEPTGKRSTRSNIPSYWTPVSWGLRGWGRVRCIWSAGMRTWRDSLPGPYWLPGYRLPST
jgi:pyruvate, water dikinase